MVVWLSVYSNYVVAKSPGLGLLPSSILQYYSAKPAEAPESLIAHLHSQGKLTTPRRKNPKSKIKK
jgi:hypothetical protein